LMNIHNKMIKEAYYGTKLQTDNDFEGRV
jgi:hypothetical protein